MHGHHHHDHGPDDATSRRLAWVLALTAGYAVAEVVGGVVANSLALLADAGHMWTDAAALGLALAAAWWSRRPPDTARTYGYQRAEILAALANGAMLLVICGLLLWEGWQRLRRPAEVDAGLMASVAAGGLAVNLVGAVLLHRASGLNARAAYLHVLGDLLGSGGTLAAAGLLAAFGWRWADPLAGMLIGAAILVAACRLLLQAGHVLMEGAPPGIDLGEVRACLLSAPGVSGLHDLHVWTLAGGRPILTAHLVVDHATPPARVLRETSALLEARFGIRHATLQIEPPDYNIVGSLTSPSPGRAGAPPRGRA